MLSSCPLKFSAALFGPNAAAVRTVDLGSGCWLLHGKLPTDLLPTAAELAALWEAKPKDREYYEMYGRSVAVPRHLRLYSNKPLTVRVSGNSFEATQIGEGDPGYLGRLLAGMPELDYNAVVANWYSSGEDYIGWHGDKEQQIDANNAPIISVSMGAARRFQVRDEGTRQSVFSELLGDGHCVVMGGPDFQRKFKHRVPKMTAQRDGLVGPRINLTVRKYNDARPTTKRALKRSDEPSHKLVKTCV